MADPLSVAASIAGLLAFGAGLSQYLLTCYDSLQSAPCNIRYLHIEVDTLCKILGNLEKLVPQSTADATATATVAVSPPHEALYGDLRTVLASCMRIFQELELLVKRFAMSARDSKLAQKWTSFRWTLKEKMITRLRGQLETHKATLNLTLLILGHFRTMTFEDSQMRIETALEDVRRILEADGVNSTNGIQADGSDATSQINLILERYLSSLESVYASSDAASGRLRPESALSSQRSMIVNPHHGSDHESVISDVLEENPGLHVTPGPHEDDADEFLSTLCTLANFSKTKDARDLDELPRLRSSIQEQMQLYMQHTWTNRAIYLALNEKSLGLQPDETVETRILGLSLELANQVYTGAVWGIGGFSRNCLARMKNIMRTFETNAALRDEFLCGRLKAERLAAMDWDEMASWPRRTTHRLTEIAIPPTPPPDIDPHTVDAHAWREERLAKDGAIKQLGALLMERAQYLVSRSVLLGLRDGEPIEHMIATRARDIQVRVWPDDYDSGTAMGEWQSRLQACVRGIADNPTLQDGILCGRIAPSQLALMAPDDMAAWGRVEAPHPGRLVTPVNYSLRPLLLSRAPSDWELDDQLVIYPALPSPSNKSVPADIYPVLVEPAAASFFDSPIDMATPVFGDSPSPTQGPPSNRRRGSSIFIGRPCALCEEPLEYKLSGERAMTLPCSHVVHEACLGEYFAETDKEVRECPQCQTSLGDVGDHDPGFRDSGYGEGFEEEFKVPELRRQEIGPRGSWLT